MNSTIDLLERLASELVAEVDRSSVVAHSDAGLTSLAASVEAHGRLVDALRVSVAAEIGERSRRELGSEGLAARFGCRNANELLQRVTRVSGLTADPRLRLGSETRARRSLAELELPPKFPMVASALSSGRLGVDAACAIFPGLEPAFDRAQMGSVEAAELELVAAATGARIASADDESSGDESADDESAGDESADGELTADVADAPAPCSADEIRLQTSVWRVLLDPDGIEPSEDRAMASRGLRLGSERGGLVRVTGSLLPETAARLKKLLDAHLSPRSGPVFQPVQGHPRSCTDSIVRPDERSEDEAPHTLEAHSELTEPHSDFTDPDSRTLDQRRHDVLIGILDAAARSPQTPMIGALRRRFW